MTGRKELWHKRLAHVSSNVIDKTIPLVDGIKLSKSLESSCKCEDCAIGKSSRKPRPPAKNESSKTTEPLGLVHTDIVGPMKHHSLNGKRYFIPLYDDCSAISLIRFLGRKDEAGAAIEEMITALETMRKGRVKNLNITVYENESVKRLRSDNAKEFLPKTFKKWLSQRGIRHELCSAYSPESNGKAERLNALLDMSRTMLIGAPHLPTKNRLWAEAVNTSCFIRNRIYSSVSKGKTPYEVIMNKKPDISHLRIFGSKAYVHIPKSNRNDKKFSSRAKVGVLVGYERGNSYRVYLPDTKRVVVSRDVTIDEHAKLDTVNQAVDKNDDWVEFEDPFIPFTATEDNAERVPPVADVQTNPDSEHDDKQTGQSSDDEEFQDATDSVTYFPNLRRSTRKSTAPDRLGIDTAMFVQQGMLQDDMSTSSMTYQDAIRGLASQEWIEAMDEEIRQIDSKGTWKLVEPPVGVRPVKNKWVYFSKLDANGKLKRRRARLVAKGFTQAKGIDYDEVFAPVAKYTTVRLMLMRPTRSLRSLLWM